MFFIMFTVIRQCTQRYIMIRRHYDRWHPRYFLARGVLITQAVALVGARRTMGRPDCRQDLGWRAGSVALAWLMDGNGHRANGRAFTCDRQRPPEYTKSRVRVVGSVVADRY